MQLGHLHLRVGTSDQARSVAAAKKDAAQARATDVLPYIETARRAGAATLREVAAARAARGMPAPADGLAWHPEQVRRVLAVSLGGDSSS